MSAEAIRVLTIRPSEGKAELKAAELWEARELLYFLTWRDVKVRYKQTALGAAWAVLQPFLTMVVFTIFFGKLAGISSDGIPYPIFSYAGLLPWTFFATAVTGAAASLVGSANLIKKVYFPRLVVPSSAVLAGLLDLAIAFVVLLAMMVFYGVRPTAAMIAVPLFVLLAFVTALGVGIRFAVWNVRYRDVKYVMPFFVQLWLFVTPVIYPASKVSARLDEMGIPSWLFGLNPMAGVVEGFRWSLLGTPAPEPGLLLASSLVSVVVLVTSVRTFRRTERSFADVV